MRPDRAATQEAASRRLALLAAELADLRAGTGPPGWVPVDPAAVVGGPAPDTPTPSTTALPVPGRHAARRTPSCAGQPSVAGARLVALADRLLPGRLPGRWLVGPAQLAAVCLVVGATLVVTAWWVVRADPRPVAPLAAPVAGEPLVEVAAPPEEGAPTGTAGEQGTTAGAAEVVVHVAGKVRRPGIQVLPGGSRVADALEAAGGPRPGVDLSTLNLARVLVDGEQVLVGEAAAAAPAGTLPPAATGSTAPGALVDLNTADQVTLETLPGVGPVTAQAILAWRDEHGGFTRVDELLEVDGIGDKTLASLAPLVTV